jgi:mannose-6-phosphate isomerase-like protein (cupin superfamily)
MKHSIVAMALIAAMSNAWSADNAIEVTPNDLQWQKHPTRPTQITVIEGALDQAGPLIYRVKFPPGYHSGPHWHPTTERGVVLSGNLYYGTGESEDMSKARLLSPGSAIVVPAQMPHYVVSKDEVILHITTEGPAKIIPVGQPSQ